MTSATSTSSIINGLDTEALRGAIDAIKTDSAKGQTRWTVASRWMGGTRSDHDIRGFVIGGEQIDRRFTLKVDEPHQLCGTNQHANPQEYLLSALNACMMVGYVAVASLMGVTLTKLEVEVTGDIDLRGFLGIDPDIKPGYDTLRQTVRIAGDGTPEQFQKIHEIVKATSPNYFNVTTAVQTRSKLVVE